MIDLTARIDRYGDKHMTHMDLYYVGAAVSDQTLVTDCVLLDISKSPASVDLGTLQGLADVTEGNSVILKTGWERHRDSPDYDECPWVDQHLVGALVAKGVCLILVDSPGVYGGAVGAEHGEMDKYLADNRAHAVENLVNLDSLPTAKFRLFCFPIYMSALNSAPCRVVADC